MSSSPATEPQPPGTARAPAATPTVITAKPGPVFHGGRLLSLDLLRGVAILLVLGRHGVAPTEGTGWLHGLASGWHHIGWAGVDLFFVLSGFLVSGLIFAEFRRTGRVAMGRFVIRRGFKIWPSYFVYIGFVACWLAWKHREGETGAVLPQLWPNLLHVQNYFISPRIHTWSLAVEEHFYLALAIGMYWLLTRRQAARMLRYFPAFVAITVVGLIALRCDAYLRQGPEQINLFATQLRLDGLLLGTLLAYYAHFEPEKLTPFARHPVASLLGGVALAAPTLYLLPEASVWTAGPGLTLMYVGFGLVLIGCLNLARSPGWGTRLFASLPARGLASIGFYSYSIYLWHLDLAYTPFHKLAQHGTAAHWSPAVVWLVAMVCYLPVAVLSGVLMSRLLEQPSLMLRDRLFPSFVKAVPAGK